MFSIGHLFIFVYLDVLRFEKLIIETLDNISLGFPEGEVVIGLILVVTMLIAL